MAMTGDVPRCVPTDPSRGHRRALASLVGWLLNRPGPRHLGDADRDRLDPYRVVPFVVLHAGCLAVPLVGISASAVGLAIALYVVRMFAVTAFYHRYFSHRAFRTSRAMQLVMAVLGCTAGQRGPLWWASHHRAHHAGADTPNDPHSPRHRGLVHCHTLWFLTAGSFATDLGRVRDWAAVPELRALERLDWLPFVVLGAGCYALGAWLEASHPTRAASGPQLLVWGFCVSTVALYHATYTVNSVAHRFGSRRFATRDDSRNNVWVALLTLGEGWHNNHHHYPGSARQGLCWWEVDPTYWGLRVLARLGLVRDLKPVPAALMRPTRPARTRTPR